MYYIGFGCAIIHNQFIVILVFCNSQTFRNSSITLLCTAKELLVKQTAFINTLRTEVSSKLFYSLTIVFFSTNSHNKASKLLSILFALCRRYTQFPFRRDRLFLVVYEACTIVFQLLNACKTRREGNSQSLRRVATPIFQTTEKKPPQSKVYLCIQTSFNFYFLRKSCFSI